MVLSSPNLVSVMTGLLHSHSGLAYLVLFASLLNVALALTVSKNPIAVAKVILWSHRIVIWGGRINIIVGTVFWYKLGFASVGIVGNLWALISFLLWGGVEVMVKRMVKEDLSCALDGAPTSKNLMLGVSLQLLIMIIIFALMSIKLLHG